MEELLRADKFSDNISTLESLLEYIASAPFCFDYCENVSYQEFLAQFDGDEELAKQEKARELQAIFGIAELNVSSLSGPSLKSRVACPCIPMALLMVNDAALVARCDDAFFGFPEIAPFGPAMHSANDFEEDSHDPTFHELVIEVRGLRHENAALKKEIVELKAELSKFRASRRYDDRREVGVQQDDISDLKRKVGELLQQNSRITIGNAFLKKKVKGLEQAGACLEAENRRLKRDNISLNSRVWTLESENGELKQRIRILEDKVAGLEKENRDQAQEIRRLVQTVSAMQEQNRDLHYENGGLKHEVSDLRQTTSGLYKNISQLNKTIQRLNDKVGSLEQHQGDLDYKIGDLLQANISLGTEQSELAATVKGLQIQIEQLQLIIHPVVARDICLLCIAGSMLGFWVWSRNLERFKAEASSSSAVSSRLVKLSSADYEHMVMQPTEVLTSPTLAPKELRESSVISFHEEMNHVDPYYEEWLRVLENLDYESWQALLDQAKSQLASASSQQEQSTEFYYKRPCPAHYRRQFGSYFDKTAKHMTELNDGKPMLFNSQLVQLANHIVHQSGYPLRWADFIKVIQTLLKNDEKTALLARSVENLCRTILRDCIPFFLNGPGASKK